MDKNEAVSNVAANLLLQLITAVCGFILPPLVIQTYGSAINGMVSSIGQFIAYLGIVEAGIGGASIAALYKPLAEKNNQKRNAVLSATRLFYNKSGFLFVILIFILALFYPFIINNSIDFFSASLMVLILGISGTAEFFLFGKYRVLLIADRKNYIISIIQIIGTVLNTVVAILLIKLGASIFLVKTVTALIFLFCYFLINFYVYRHYVDLNLRVPPDNASINQKKNVLVHQICALVVVNSPTIIITIFCGLKDASIYSVYFLIFNALGNLMGSFSTGMQAFFGQSLYGDDINKTQRLYNKFETFYFVVCGWAYSCSYLLIMPFMKVYTRNMTDANYLQPMLAILFVVSGLGSRIRTPSGLLIEAAGHYRNTQWRSILEASICLIGSIVFVLLFGLSGVLLGNLCSSIYRTIDMIIYSSTKVLRVSPLRSFIKLLILAILYGLSIFYISYLKYDVVSYNTWFIYALVVGSFLAVPCLIISVWQFMRRI